MLPKIESHECSKEDCHEISDAKGLCKNHYRQWRRKEGLDAPRTKEFMKLYGRSLAGKYTALKRAAKDKALGFDITREDHERLLSQLCVYCDGPLTATGHSLDRKDNSLGYLLTNVVTCCVSCNRIKNKILTHEEMTVAMKAIMQYRKGGSCGS